VRDSEFGSFRFVEESDDGGQVIHLALTDRFWQHFYGQDQTHFVLHQIFSISEW
jgi:hypothetical protein